MRSCRVAFALLALLPAVIACQPLPAPFAHEPGSRSRAIGPLPDSAGILVMEIEGMPRPQGTAAEHAMTDALAANNIPAATVGGNDRSQIVIGTARTEAASDGGRYVRATWYLLSADGTLLGSHSAGITLSRDAWMTATRKAFRPLADSAAARFAALIQGPPVTASAVPPPVSRPTLHVRPIEGVPGKGNAVLRHEMEGALRRRSYVVSETLAPDALVVSGSVIVGVAEAGKRSVTVSWSVLDSGGRELGKLTQRNAVPSARIESGWPGLAALIAESAAGGVDQILRNRPRAALPSGARSGG